MMQFLRAIAYRHDWPIPLHTPMPLRLPTLKDAFTEDAIYYYRLFTSAPIYHAVEPPSLLVIV